MSMSVCMHADRPGGQHEIVQGRGGRDGPFPREWAAALDEAGNANQDDIDAMLAQTGSQPRMPMEEFDAVVQCNDLLRWLRKAQNANSDSSIFDDREALFGHARGGARDLQAAGT